MNSYSRSQFLRAVLWIDGSVSIAAGALHFFGAASLQSLTGINATLYASTGLFLLVFGLIVAWMAKQDHAPSFMVLTLIGGNVVWALASGAMLAQGGYTAIGNGYLVFNALWVLLMAALEHQGLHRPV